MAEALTKAIAIVGGQTQLARLLGVKQANVWHWLKKAERVPGEYVLAIEKATGGQVSRHDLRPDLYPDPQSGNAAPVIAEEDVWRAQLYGLLGRCLARRPDNALLTALAQIQGDGTPLGQALAGLAECAGTTSLERAQEEYDALFIGLPRGELVPYASFYRTGFLYERPLAKLRGDMARLGYARADGVFEPEDHMGALCELMALMIRGDEGHAAADLPTQERMFRQHIAPWADRFFTDLEQAGSAKLYRPVGTIGRLFIAIEGQAFALAA
ncbi:MAG TPA: molecular chaperone TorD family protein [Ferrovibrio sp.]|uniref:molecular chaperone TorD family protein n=1 Tax=Ferrovibrio sp. TaxID=1917215 RepID=UPI002ED20AB7